MLLATMLSATLFGAANEAGRPAESITQINVEIDYMETAGHSHRPSQAVIDAAVQMFACQGITLNVVVDEAIPELPVMRCTNPGTGSFFNCLGPESFVPIKATYGGLGKLPGWHYCVFGHQYDNGDGLTSSGLAELNGNDFVVTLGSFQGQTGTLFDQAATFVHELGHNLGLRHWSPNSAFVGGPYSPTYASVMSYQFQLSGVRSRLMCLGLTSTANHFKELDYSSGRMPTVLEAALNETEGVGMRLVDWDCDGVVDTTPVAKDLDEDREWCLLGAGATILDDHDDWASLTDSTEDAAVYRDLIDHPYETCITAGEHAALQALFAGSESLPDPDDCWGTGAQPPLFTESCQPQMYWIDDGATFPFLGTGDNPFSLGLGLGVPEDGAVLYLQEGTYTTSGTPIVIARPLTLGGVGPATIDP